jgi:glutamyl-Q tRNA(Asp) synthetase
MTLTSNYIGRFAPSPSGPLHFGSLVSAIASFLDARKNNGKWLLRIEDLDPPRESKEAPGIIIDQLVAHGLHWDGEVLYQSSRLGAYSEALQTLIESDMVYPCDCARKSFTTIYPGVCRHKNPNGVSDVHALRLKTDDGEIILNDRLLGRRTWHLLSNSGDFIVKRKDGLDAYQLAVVVDDAFQRVTHVVRGIDLLDSTPRQIYLGEKLGLSPLEYLHHPVVIGESGDKLSKQTHAAAIENSDAVSNITRALRFLGQEVQVPSPDIKNLLDKAIDSWQLSAIPLLAAQIPR